MEYFHFFVPTISKMRKKLEGEEITKRKEMKKMYNTGLEKPDPEKTVSSVRRARAHVHRIILANFGMYKDKNGFQIPPKFLTLTFTENISDLKSANYELTKFVQWLNYTFRNHIVGSLQYVCVPEFQERGAVHYHLILFNFPFIDKVFSRIRVYWNHQFNLKTISRNQDVRAVANYMTKYITKQATDGRFFGQKRYFASREVQKSILLDNGAIIELVCHVAESFLVKRKILNVPYLGDIEYKVYYLRNGNVYSLSPWLDYLDPEIKQKILLADKNIKT